MHPKFPPAIPVDRNVANASVEDASRSGGAKGPRAGTSTQKGRPCCASQTGLSPTWPREATRHSIESSLTRPRVRPRQPLHPAEAGEIVEALDSLSRAVSDL